MALALGWCRGAATARAADERPNILFIMSDDHAWHAVGSYGSKINQTPHIDRLAKEGMRFTNCLVTNSICGPCRAVILTGKHSHVNGFMQNGQRFDGSQPTVAKLLQAAGYQAALVGKWHLESAPTGFDFYQHIIDQGVYYNPPMRTNQGKVGRLGFRVVKPEGYVTDIITDVALDWLESTRDKQKPFFMMLHHKAPHREWAPGPKHLTMYDEADIPEPETLFDDYSGRGKAAKTQDMTIDKAMRMKEDLKLDWTPPNLTPDQKKAWEEAYRPKDEAFHKARLTGKDLLRWKYQRYIKDYLRCVASVDDNVGRVLDYLDESGLAKNTIVIYTSDQGFYLGDHGWFDKRFIYEESLRTPLLVRYPGHIKPGTVNDDLVQNLDFAETFLDYAGEKIPADMQGRSLRPVLAGKTPSDWRTSAYYHYYEFPGPHSVARHYGVRTKRYTLAHFYQLDEWELYDLEKDPRQMRSVYDDAAYAKTVEELKRELTQLRARYQVPGVDPDAL